MVRGCQMLSKQVKRVSDVVERYSEVVCIGGARRLLEVVQPGVRVV